MFQVIKLLEAGYRLPPPKSCPKVLHKLMLSCWNQKRTERPNFYQLFNTLRSFVEQPNLLSDSITCR